MRDAILYNRGIDCSIGSTQIPTPKPVRFDEDSAESCFDELKNESATYQEALQESLEAHTEAIRDMASIIDNLLTGTLHVNVKIPFGKYHDEWLVEKCNGQRLWSGYYRYRSDDARYTKPKYSAILIFDDEESLALFRLAVD